MKIFKSQIIISSDGANNNNISGQYINFIVFFYSQIFFSFFRTNEYLYSNYPII